MSQASSAKKIALVTGANKGIGFAIVEALARNSQLHVLLGSRDASRGAEAVNQLKEKLGGAWNNNIEALAIDVDDEKSVENAAAEVKAKFGGLDILVNNAGMAFKGDAFDENVARTTFKTNYYGTIRVCNHFMPLIREDGRVVMVSSSAGKSALSKMSAELQQQFMKDNLTVQQLDQLMENFVTDVREGKWAERGWPTTCYGVSKTGMSMFTRILARDNQTRGVLINACCPGWVRTDMAGPNAPRTPDEGAQTPTMLCFLPSGSPTGTFWKDNQASSWI